MSGGHLFCADRNEVKKLSVLVQDYSSVVFKNKIQKTAMIRITSSYYKMY